MICSGGVGAGTQKGQKTGPRSYSIPRKRLRGPMLSRLPNSELSCTVGACTPAGRHLFSATQRFWAPGLLSA